MLTVSPTLADRHRQYFHRLGPEECWPWFGATAGPMDHGKIYVGKRDGKPHREYAHRVAWFLAHGSWPGELKVRHTCDFPPCQNPAHLLLGTQAQNIADMIARQRDRKRGRPGIEHHGVKLADSEVIEIRRLRSAGRSYYSLAPQFGISQSQVRRICIGERWKHLDAKGT